MPLPFLAAAAGGQAKKLIAPILLFALGVGLFLFIYLSGKSAGKNKQKVKDGEKIAEYEQRFAGQMPLPNSGKTIPVGWTPDSLVSQLYREMEGLDWGFANQAKMDAFNLLSSLNDDQITAVYNRFNMLYKTKANDNWTLTQWIYNESGSDARIRALAALDRLGLK